MIDMKIVRNRIWAGLPADPADDVDPTELTGVELSQFIGQARDDEAAADDLCGPF